MYDTKFSIPTSVADADAGPNVKSEKRRVCPPYSIVDQFIAQ
jgi:hypothetical protein